MAKYIFVRDFTASQHFFDQPPPQIKKFTFRKGDVVEAKETMDFSTRKIWVTTMLGADDRPIEYRLPVFDKSIIRPYTTNGTAIKHGSPNGNGTKVSPAKVLLGIGVVVVVIVLVAKFAK